MSNNRIQQFLSDETKNEKARLSIFELLNNFLEFNAIGEVLMEVMTMSQAKIPPEEIANLQVRAQELNEKIRRHKLTIQTYQEMRKAVGLKVIDIIPGDLK